MYILTAIYTGFCCIKKGPRIYPCPLNLYHLVKLQSLSNGFFLLWRCSRLLTVRQLGLIIVLPLDDPVFLLHLSNIQVCNMETVLFSYPFLYLSVSSLGLSAGQIQLVHIHFNLDMMLRFR